MELILIYTCNLGQGVGRTVSVNPSHSTCTIRNVSAILFPQQQSDTESESEENDNEESIEVTKETNIEETVSSDSSTSGSESDSDPCTIQSPYATKKGKVTGVASVMGNHYFARRRKAWKKHTITVHDPEENEFPKERQDMISYALRKSLHLQSCGDLTFSTAKGMTDTKRHFVPADFSAPHLKSGWAKRPRIGKMYGPKYIEKFRPDIQELYLFGEVDKKKQT